MEQNSTKKFGLLRICWFYRFFIINSIIGEYKTKFARSRLGLMWVVLHPLTMVLAYSLVLSQIMRGRFPGIDTEYAYPIYILAGLICWNLFEDIINRCLDVFISNANLLKKIYFPIFLLPIIAVSNALINSSIMILIAYIAIGILDEFNTHSIFWLFPLIAITTIFAASLGIFLGIINVFIRDIGQFVRVMMRFLFWGTPVVYTLSIIPDKFRELIALNPLQAIVVGYQDVMLYGKSPEFTTLSYPFVVSITLITLIMLIYKKASEQIVDAL